MSQKVWSKFSGRSGDTRFIILDAPGDRLDEARDFYVEHYVAGESVCKAAGIKKNKDAIAEYAAFASQQLSCLDQLHVLVCCIEKEEGIAGDLVGVAFSYLSTTEHPFEIKAEPETKEVQTMLKMSEGMISMYDVLSKQKVNSCLDGIGIVVHPDFRGLGIAQEFLKVRRLICKEKGIPITSGWMTSLGTQKAAARDGYETVHEFNFKEFGKQYNVSFEDAPETCKHMMYRIE